MAPAALVSMATMVQNLNRAFDEVNNKTWRMVSTLSDS